MKAGRRTAIRGLYAVTPDLVDTARLGTAVGAALSGGATLLQYRNKTAGQKLRLEQARTLQALCTQYGALLIVNDDVELARALDADGVHLGADDGSVAAAREALGAGKLIGVSCYDEIARARAACALGADYVAFGSFFPSRVKPGAVHAPLELLTFARREIAVPVVAIGGITAVNASELIAAGADAVAVISALFDAPDITAAARGFSKLFE